MDTYYPPSFNGSVPELADLGFVNKQHKMYNDIDNDDKWKERIKLKERIDWKENEKTNKRKDK